MSTCRNDDTKNVTCYRFEKTMLMSVLQRKKKINILDKFMRRNFGIYKTFFRIEASIYTLLTFKSYKN